MKLPAADYTEENKQDVKVKTPKVPSQLSGFAFMSSNCRLIFAIVF